VIEGSWTSCAICGACSSLCMCRDGSKVYYCPSHALEIAGVRIIGQTVTCEVCDTKFVKKHSAHRFCCNTCKHKNKRELGDRK